MICNVLQTIIIRVEAVLNDCPLIYLTSATGDPKPLTSSHQLYERQINFLPQPGVENERYLTHIISYHGMIHYHLSNSRYVCKICDSCTLFSSLIATGRMDQVQMLQLNYIYSVMQAPRHIEQWHTFSNVVHCRLSFPRLGCHH